ncbi:MAG: CDP-diacylglycerol--glycerol-3-phosphate 3-phosphatidyltransferase [Clostridia bacterium]|nr:CDP-diacylglycerol--glycerol-3-phosphate 3-phosphatidyltransferase [Clostridia bacterium]
MSKLKIKMNVPNILTMARIFCTPLIVLMFLLPISNGVGVYVALGIYVLGCLTDLLDGKIARKYNLITDFGKFMDQIADKFITTTAMILVLFAGATAGWIADWLAILMLLVVVLRDILISGIRMVAANKNFVIPADIFGKVKSFFLDISNVVLLLYIALRASVDAKFVDYVQYIGLAIMIVGVVLSIVSCVNYTVKAIKVLSSQTEEKKEDEETEEVEKDAE